MGVSAMCRLDVHHWENRTTHENLWGYGCSFFFLIWIYFFFLIWGVRENMDSTIHFQVENHVSAVDRMVGTWWRRAAEGW